MQLNLLARFLRARKLVQLLAGTNWNTLTTETG